MISPEWWCRPFPGRVFADASDIQSPRVVLEEDQGVEAFAGDGVPGKKSSNNAFAKIGVRHRVEAVRSGLDTSSDLGKGPGLGVYQLCMAEEVVEVTIGTDGAVEMAVAGVAGMQCVSETDDLVRLLGGEVVEQRLTDEAYLDVEEDQQEQQWGR